jgi:hypothetical protein
MPYVITGFARLRLLPKPLNGVTLALKPLESGECRLVHQT